MSSETDIPYGMEEKAFEYSLLCVAASLWWCRNGNIGKNDPDMDDVADVILANIGVALFPYLQHNEPIWRELNILASAIHRWERKTGKRAEVFSELDGLSHALAGCGKILELFGSDLGIDKGDGDGYNSNVSMN